MSYPKILFFILISVLIIAGCHYWPLAKAQDFRADIIKEEPPAEPEVLVLTSEQQKVRSEIMRQADIYDIDFQEALNIAECESELKMRAENPNSSAKGVFQFLHGTWNDYCEGSVYDYIANIKCFMIIYPIYPQFWSECL
jgi:hypothetical protein